MRCLRPAICYSLRTSCSGLESPCGSLGSQHLRTFAPCLPLTVAAKSPLRLISTCDGRDAATVRSSSGTDGGFGSALSTSPAAWEEARAPDEDCNLTAVVTQRDSFNHVYDNACGVVVECSSAGTASDILSAAAVEVMRLQWEQQNYEQVMPQQEWRTEGVPPMSHCDHRDTTAAADAHGWEGDVHSNCAVHRSVVFKAECATAVEVAAAVVKSSSTSPTAALFRRYLHELRLGWPVLLPVVLLLFANISTQVRYTEGLSASIRMEQGTCRTTSSRHGESPLVTDPWNLQLPLLGLHPAITIYPLPIRAAAPDFFLNQYSHPTFAQGLSSS